MQEDIMSKEIYDHELEERPHEGALRDLLVKKGGRRLAYSQVKALEKAFEVENRLESERKVRLACQLGLQPSQVAVWFQNRRARWKTKQMERDYTLLKHNFEALKIDRDKLLQEKEQLQAELTRLKGQTQLILKAKLSRELPEEEGGHQRQLPTRILKGSLPAMASGSSADDAGKTAVTINQEGSVYQEENQLQKQLEEETSPNPVTVLHNRKLLQIDSLSSKEDSTSGIHNDQGTTEDSTSMNLHDYHDYLTAQHWRLPTAARTQLFEPTIKAEEWPEQGDNVGSFNMHMDTAWNSWWR